ncbi:related to aromatic-L-amino-acid decarboxylase [Serendipita indica DSM 11827]|uniref:Related to aromatic-L-amino-acid decarboxylase n=1 Tax=Serendipita indica (strain DSM 11827) TaxID=1109443 RepID=G4TCH9_SERID|nr:related to aromatic-L-amino-acid decarboxylase [Serendipita indica DSM 11827]
MDIEQFRKAAYQAIDHICDYYYSLEKQSVVSQVEPGYLSKLLPDHPPAQGESSGSHQRRLSQSHFTGPASTELEAIVMDWSARLLGLDEKFLTASGKGGGVLQTTASDAALLATVVARTNYTKLHPGVAMEKLVIYGTTQTHSLGAKAALILGVHFRALEVKAEDNFSLRGSTLQAALDEDREKGLHPYILMTAEPSIWLHVDAAWAGVAFALPEYRQTGRLDAINKYAHSFCTNFHKDRVLLTDSLDVTPEFLRTHHGMVIDYRNWHLSLGRKFRSLKLWFVLRAFGVEGFRKHLRNGIDNANALAERVKQSDVFELATPPTLSLVVFRIAPQALVGKKTPSDTSIGAELNTLNLKLHEKTTSDLFLTRTDLGGDICLRMSVGGLRTEKRHVLHAFDVLEKAAKDILKDSST